MDVNELTGPVTAFIKANPLIALVIGGIVLFAFYRRPALSFFVLCLIVLVAGVYYVIMSMSSSAVSEKERLLRKSEKKNAPLEETIRIDPSRMLR